MRVYIRFMDDSPNGVFVCQSFKVYEGDEKTYRFHGQEYVYNEMIVELDGKSVLRDVLDIESL